MCAVEVLMAHAQWGPEVDSVALIGVDVFLAAGSNGVVRPLVVRSLDGQERSATEKHLRKAIYSVIVFRIFCS